MKEIIRWLALGIGPMANITVAGLSDSLAKPQAGEHWFCPSSGGLRFVGFKSQDPDAEAALVAPQKKQCRVVAYCVLDGASGMFALTSDAQLVKIGQGGEAVVIGIIVAPSSSEFLYMIKTEKGLIGIKSSGELVNAQNGAVIGAVIPAEEKSSSKESAADSITP